MHLHVKTSPILPDRSALRQLLLRIDPDGFAYKNATGGYSSKAKTSLSTGLKKITGVAKKAAVPAKPKASTAAKPAVKKPAVTKAVNSVAKGIAKVPAVTRPQVQTVAKSIAAGAVASIITAKQTTPIVKSEAIKAALQAAAIAKGKEYAKKAADAANAFKSYLQTTQCKTAGKASSSDIPEWLKIFGAGSESIFQLPIGKYQVIPDPFPITLENGTYITTVITKSGNTSKPISIYGEQRTDDPLQNAAGVKINIGNVSFKGNLSLQNAGLSVSSKSGSTTVSYGSKFDLLHGKVGITASQTIQTTESTSETSYSSFEIGGWHNVLIVGAIVITGGLAAPVLVTN